jgi:hypothetical protein
MIGVEVPYPGMRYFHFTFCVSLHVRGGVASAAVPVAAGPRHCGQLPAVAPRSVWARRVPAPAIREMDFMAVVDWHDP